MSNAGRRMTAAVVEGARPGLMSRESAKGRGRAWGPSRHLVNKVVKAAVVDWRHVPRALRVDGPEADARDGKMAVGTCVGDAGSVIEGAGKRGWWDGMPHELAKWRSFCRQSGVPGTAGGDKEGIPEPNHHGKAKRHRRGD